MSPRVHGHLDFSVRTDYPSDLARLAWRLEAMHELGDPRRRPSGALLHQPREILPDNAGGRTFPTYEETAIAGVAAAIYVRPDWWPGEYDGEDPDVLGAALKAAQGLRIPMLAAASGQPGHCHLFAHVPSEALQRRLALVLRPLGVKPQRWIRPPLTPHRLGLPVHLLQPTDPSAFLAALRRPGPYRPVPKAEHQADPQAPQREAPQRAPAAPMPAPEPIAPAEGQGRRSATLTPCMRAILSASEPSGYERLQSLADSAVQHDWSFENFLVEVLDERHPGGLGRCKRGRARAERSIGRCWRKAERFVEDHPPERRGEPIPVRVPVPSWEAAVAVMVDLDLPDAERAAYLAAVAAARAAGSTTAHLAVRDCTVLGPLNRIGTAGEALRALQARGLVRLAARHRGGRAREWELSDLSYSAQIRDTQIPPPPVPAPGHDAFRPGGGAGVAGWLLVFLLRGGGLPVGALAAGAGRSPATVRRVLGRLEAGGLARRDGLGCWERVPEADFDAAAVIFETAGTRGRLQDAYRVQRREWREFLEQRGAWELPTEHPEPAPVVCLDESPWPEGARCMRPAEAWRIPRREATRHVSRSVSRDKRPVAAVSCPPPPNCERTGALSAAEDCWGALGANAEGLSAALALRLTCNNATPNPRHLTPETCPGGVARYVEPPDTFAPKTARSAHARARGTPPQFRELPAPMPDNEGDLDPPVSRKRRTPPHARWHRETG